MNTAATTINRISITEVRRRLAVGTEYTGELVGSMGRFASSSIRVTRRRVVRQNGDMASLMLDGPKAGQQIWLNWRNVIADEIDSQIVLSARECGGVFLRISNISEST